MITSAAVPVEVIHPEIYAAAPKWTLPRPAVEPVPQAVAQIRCRLARDARGAVARKLDDQASGTDVARDD
ncbi:hypothetical protein ACFWMV_10135 [Streptomyces mutabilis]|uniref:hypothetical protein n=1 Tax=Streptomyces mutabilis TaxID=67332 RepID=UPI0036597C7E